MIYSNKFEFWCHFNWDTVYITATIIRTP